MRCGIATNKAGFPARARSSRYEYTRYYWLVSCLVVFYFISVSDTNSQQDTAGQTYRIAIFLSSDKDRCYKPGVVAAIRHFTQQRASQINSSGGLNGRKLELVYFDDYSEIDLTEKNVTQAVQDPDIIGMIGISSSTRGKRVIDTIGQSGIPYISEISRSDLFENYSNIFSLAPAVHDEVKFVGEFTKDKNFERPVFIGYEGNLYSQQYRDGLAEFVNGEIRSFWFPDKGDFSLDPDVMQDVIEKLKSHNTDIVFLSIYSGPGSEFLKALHEAGVKVPVFVVLGRIGTIQNKLNITPADFEMFALAREGIPGVFNERVVQRIWRFPHQKWIFNDTIAKGLLERCESEAEPEKIKDIDNRSNQRAIGRGLQYSDMLTLIVNIANELTTRDVPTLRKQIQTRLAALQEGTEIYRGWWQDWSFTRSRGAAEDSLLLVTPDKATLPTLLATQYRRTIDGLKKIPVIYIGIDMVRIFRVNSNEKNFQAEFYLSFRGDGDIDLSDIEFTNAFQAQLSNEKLISTHPIHGGQDNGLFPDGLKLYKVTGTFMFEPDLSLYPFDSQRFSISFQSANASKPFLIQPQSKQLRETHFEADGWKFVSHYVGSDQDIISVVGQQIGKKSILPLYRFNYTWTMHRLATDFYLRVIVPLIVILLVTYLSVFIPENRLESVVAIQVTALLSSIALYLAIPKVEFEHPTISDQVFVVTYFAIFLMLGLSILRSNSAVGKWKFIKRLLKAIQIILLPLIVMTMIAVIVTQSSEANAVQLKSGWNSVVTSVINVTSEITKYFN